MIEYDIVVIGAGISGLAAAIKAKEEGNDSILILERDGQLGGELNQSIYTGFQIDTSKEELTGPEYADRFIQKVEEMKIDYRLDTTVLDLTENKLITAVNGKEGIITIKAKAIILAMGCRERQRGVVNIPGSRSAGVYSAGTAQKFITIEGYMPGKKVVILGSDDIALIMARRMTLEGAEVKAVVENNESSSRIKKNIQKCLEYFNIPILLSHTVTEIKGKHRVEGVVITEIDNNKRPIKGTEKYMECDTLLLSVELTPENELAKSAHVHISEETNGPNVDEKMRTNVDGIFACGDVVYVHNIFDSVESESYQAGKSAFDYVTLKNKDL